MNNLPQDTFLFYNAFLHSTDAIIITNTKGEILEVNLAFSSLFGWKREEVIGRRTNFLRSEKTTNNVYKKMWDSINNYGEWKGEIVNRHKDGSLVPILLSITPIIQNRQKIGYMGIQIDMREQIEQKKRRDQTEKLATIGQMASKVAHEIRNPLSTISLNAELLQDELSDSQATDFDEARSLLQVVINEVDRLANMTNEYLMFSRLPESHKELVDLNQLLVDFAYTFETEVSFKGADLKVSYCDQPVMVEIDKAQIRRVLLNMVRNSVEAIPEEINGQIQLHLSKNNTHIDLFIIDNGRGVPTKNREKIFNPFFTNKDLGTGLGLSISKQIIEEHEGSVSYIDSDEPGAHFLIRLPLKG